MISCETRMTFSMPPIIAHTKCMNFWRFVLFTFDSEIDAIFSDP